MEEGEKNKTILVMDDEEMIGEIICQMLSFFGFDTVRVADGVDAVKTYKKHLDDGIPFRAVILDLTIPGGMGGKETVTEILAIDQEATVFVSSGHSADPIMINFREHGFAGVICKPFDMADMEKTLAPLL